MEYENLLKWGLSERFTQEAQTYENLCLARVTEQHRNLYTVVTEDGFLQASVSGKYAFRATGNADFPAVGDWVMIERSDTSIIHTKLVRKSVFIRKAAGTSKDSQVVAANIDTVFICMALNSDFNLRRLERYLATAWDSGATPVIVLTKSDLCDDLSRRLDETAQISMGAETIVCSKLKDDGYAAIAPFIVQGKTIAFIGSSGVGKSTLINHLIGEDSIATSEIRADGKGRHTTTFRQLILLPDGGLVIDTPGMRELGAITADFENAFADIEELAGLCKFSDCSHTTEPGCAIQSAIEDGSLDSSRYENYKKLQTETDYSGLSSKQREEEKIKRMFGGKSEMKQFMSAIKKRNKH